MNAPLLALGLAAVLAGRHPIHSSSISLTLAPGSARATAVLRCFAEDFPPARDSAAIRRYLAEHFRLVDRAGRAVPLELAAVRSEGLALVLTLEAAVPVGLSGARVSFSVLAERFRDQVNLLQARYGGRSVTLFFIAGDGAKSLP